MKEDEVAPMPEIDTRHEERVEAIAHTLALTDRGSEAISVYADKCIWDEDWAHYLERKAKGYGAGLRVALYDRFARAILSSPAFRSLISEAVGEEREAFDAMLAALKCCESRMKGNPMWDSQDAGPSQTLTLVRTAISIAIRARSEGEAATDANSVKTSLAIGCGDEGGRK